jgi:RNA polymerase sigma-70 factor (ECF subfamily)
MARNQRDSAHRVERGDLDTLSALLEEHGPALRRSLCKRLNHHPSSELEIEDVMQVTYLEAFLRFSHFVPQNSESFTAWLRRIARNNLRDAVRELRRVRRPHLRPRAGTVGGDGSSFLLMDWLDGDAKTPSREVAGVETEAIMKAAVARLPADYRRVVELCDLEGKSTAQAAALLGRTQGAVCMLRARAHDRLRDLLGPPSRFFSDSG